MKNLVIFGTQQISEVIGFYFTHDSEYRIVAYCVDADYLKESTFQSRPVVAFEELNTAFPPDNNELFIAISYQGMNAVRAQKFKEGRHAGYRFSRYISSKASHWPGLTIGDNSFVMEENTLQPFTCIGDNTILWSGNHIGHHSRIGDHCFISSHVVVSGNVTVSDYCFLGVNATIRDNVNLAEASLIGAGTIVLEDTAPETVIAAEASPIRKIRSRRLKKI